MSIKINYKSGILKNPSNNLILFAGEKFDIDNIKKYISNSEFSYIQDLLKINDLNKNLFVFELNSKKKIVLISIKKTLKNSEIENLGAELFDRINYGKNTVYLLNSDTIQTKNKEFLGHLLHGVKLKSYEFNKYKSKKETKMVTVNAVLNNRELMGATNPIDAEEGTLRKKYGISIDKNSVHGSDSVANAKIEIDFFFRD